MNPMVHGMFYESPSQEGELRLLFYGLGIMAIGVLGFPTGQSSGSCANILGTSTPIAGCEV